MTLPSGKEEENSEKIPQRDLSGISRRIPLIYFSGIFL